MKYYKYLILSVLVITIFSSCAIAPVVPPRGVLYTKQKAPLFGGKTVGSKEGTASTYTILFLIGWGDASIEAAARNGEIEQINHLNYELFNILGIYQKFTTIVRGE